MRSHPENPVPPRRRAFAAHSVWVLTVAGLILFLAVRWMQPGVSDRAGKGALVLPEIDTADRGPQWADDEMVIVDIDEQGEWVYARWGDVKQTWKARGLLPEAGEEPSVEFAGSGASSRTSR